MDQHVNSLSMILRLTEHFTLDNHIPDFCGILQTKQVEYAKKMPDDALRVVEEVSIEGKTLFAHCSALSEHQAPEMGNPDGKPRCLNIRGDVLMP